MTELSTKRRGRDTVLDRFRVSGAVKVAFPRRSGPLEAILLNIAGGLTGGDRIALDLAAGTRSHLVATTQAAERGYRADSGTAQVSTRLSVAAGATLHWLPQELILFDGAALDRRLCVTLAADARFLMVEPVIFGRRAMGERIGRAYFRDSVDIRRDGRPIYLERVLFDGPVERQLTSRAVADGAGAMASVVFVGGGAGAELPGVRRHLRQSGGASLLAPDILVARLLAEDGYCLRESLVPVLEHLSGAGLPRSWSL